MMPMILQPDWPAPANIRAYSTSRQGGFSQTPFNEFNLGFHSGDDPISVKKNRDLLKQTLNLPTEPIWLKQTHSNLVVAAHSSNRDTEADASYALQKDQICLIMTADCLPILLCHKQGRYIAAIHAGWRGLAKNIIKQTLAQCPFPPEELIAWLGPAIGPQAFEVGIDVFSQFVNQNPAAKQAFISLTHEKWLANLYQLASLFLNQLGIRHIYGGNFCTFSDPERFFSYRRDGEKTGRMATFIWITE